VVVLVKLIQVAKQKKNSKLIIEEKKKILIIITFICESLRDFSDGNSTSN
jgi:hypothetical protein